MTDPHSFDDTTDAPPLAGDSPHIDPTLDAVPPPVAPTLIPATAQAAVLDSDVTECDDGSAHPMPHERVERLGTIIAGRYTLVECIGEGGMGSVYRAQQSEPVKRDVALKLIKVGMDTRSVLARFNAERQALALMDHPNIARVYDGGTTPTGQPFFVMELVQGKTITQYCDEHRLTPQARLELFIQVCHAVQHAHQKGIIHRDLKPSNILVTEVDGRATPKVIDFGVAKATEQRLLDQSFADTGAIVGTPVYMSPEQADPSSMDIDTRTDVYALGVVLYELLTGAPPIDASQFKRGAILEMLRMVREVEPPRPSTKLSTIAGLPNIAANRSTEPSKLARLLQGELDWVVMKALEKDRTRRYDSANGFARDIQRYLADEVVEARPPSRAYRFKKFVRRNKVQVVAAVLVFGALVGGIIGTSIGLVQAQEARRAEADQRRIAEDERNKAIAARQAAETAQHAEEQQRRIAERNEGLAKDERNNALHAKAKAEEAEQLAVKLRAESEKARETTATQRKLALDTVRDVLLRVDDLMRNDAKLAPLRIEIIRRMLDDVDRIRDHAINNPLEDRTEATAYARIGDIYLKSNRPQDAHDWLRKSYLLVKQLVQSDPNDSVRYLNLGAISRSLAEAEWRLGNGQRSLALHQEALLSYQKRRALLPKNDDEVNFTFADYEIAICYADIAYDQLRMGEPQAALTNYRLAERQLNGLPAPLNMTLRTIRIRNEIAVRIADAHARLQDTEAAEKQFNYALKDREDLLSRHIGRRDTTELIKTDIGQSRMYLGDFQLMIRRDKVAALKEYQICHDIFLKQIKDDPDNLDLHQRLGASYYRLGLVASDATKAKEMFEKSLQWREGLAKIDTKDMPAQVEYLLSLARLGRHDDVDRLAKRILQQAGMDPQSLFQTACGYAICATTGAPMAEEYRKRTYEVLERLVKAGWKDPVGIQTDPDFEFIRTDARFKELTKPKK